jgi:ferritin-like metal-binding protein YciE
MQAVHSKSSCNPATNEFFTNKENTMSKTTKKKTGKTGKETNASFSRENNDAHLPDRENPSRYQPTDETGMHEPALDAEDGLLKLFTDSLKDIYWAENHLIKALPVMIRASALPALQQALNGHFNETLVHVQRLEEIFERLGREPQARKCDAMEGLAKEGEAVIETTDMGTPAREHGIIMSSQKVEHYEIAAYSGLVRLAHKLDLGDIAGILSKTLEEEQEADVKLAMIAEEDQVAEEEASTKN